MTLNYVTAHACENIRNDGELKFIDSTNLRARMGQKLFMNETNWNVHDDAKPRNRTHKTEIVYNEVYLFIFTHVISRPFARQKTQVFDVGRQQQQITVKILRWRVSFLQASL